MPGALRLPEAVAFAPGGDLLVGDDFGGRVQRFRARMRRIGILARGRVKTLPLTTTIRGRTTALSVSAATVKAMREALRAGGTVTAGVVTTGTAHDGVADTASIVWSFR
jgi:hypothetical protein